MSFVHVKTYKRGATHTDGTPWMCVRCGIERSRRRQAVVTAIWKTGYKLPVGYCADHVPAEIRPTSAT